MANPLASSFYDSLDRCLAAPGFLTRFYDLFLASSPEVRAKFQHTDFTRQRRMLSTSLHLILAASYGAPESHTHLARLASLHGKHGRDITPHLYELWLEALVAAASEHDPDFSPRLGDAWREMLRPGIDTLLAGYDSPPPA